jgi:hypothetical protein
MNLHNFLNSDIPEFYWKKYHLFYVILAPPLINYPCASVSLSTLVSLINPLKPTGYFMSTRFNIHKFYVLPTQCIYVFCMDLRTNSDYFPVQH